MISTSSIQDLMLAAAPLADLIVADYHPDKVTWHMAANREMEIFGELDASRDVLVLSVPLERPALVDRQVLILALRANHAGSGFDGLRLTLEGNDGPFWLVQDIGIDGIDAGGLARRIRAMAEKAAQWRQRLADLPRSSAEDLSLLSGFGAIRI